MTWKFSPFHFVRSSLGRFFFFFVADISVLAKHSWEKFPPSISSLVMEVSAHLWFDGKCGPRVWCYLVVMASSGSFTIFPSEAIEIKLSFEVTASKKKKKGGKKLWVAFNLFLSFWQINYFFFLGKLVRFWKIDN